MWTLSRMVCMGMLVCAAAIDIRSRKIPLVWLAAGSLLAAGYRIFGHRGDIWLIMGGAAVGAAFLLISRVTKESVGYGDSWTILILGIYLGLWELITVLAGAFFLLAAVLAAWLTMKKMSKRLRIPFIPFLLAGYAMSVLW